MFLETQGGLRRLWRRLIPRFKSRVRPRIRLRDPPEFQPTYFDRHVKKAVCTSHLYSNIFSETVEYITESGILINIEPESPGHHKTVRLTLSGGIEFLITSKSFKDSLRFEIVKDFQLSRNVGGILGQVVRPQGNSITDNFTEIFTFHNFLDFIIRNNEMLITDGKKIISDLVWDNNKNCYEISEWDLPLFLGHQVFDYKTSGLFTTLSNSWFNNMNINLLDLFAPK